MKEPEDKMTKKTFVRPVRTVTMNLQSAPPTALELASSLFNRYYIMLVMRTGDASPPFHQLYPIALMVDGIRYNDAPFIGPEVVCHMSVPAVLLDRKRRDAILGTRLQAGWVDKFATASTIILRFNPHLLESARLVLQYAHGVKKGRRTSKRKR